MTLFGDGPILFVSPHTDDVELGCGGTLARAIEEHADVRVLALSTAEESRPPGTPRTVLRDEFVAAMDSLGVPRSKLFIEAFPVRQLSAYRQDVLDVLIRIRSEVQPAAIFAPASSDIHQDHEVVHAECLRAFKDRTVMGYELPWNHIHFDANAFVTLERRHVDAKWNALCSYRTQLDLGRPYFKREFIEGLALVRGTQVKADFAEAFEVERMRY